jgi:hypothetical protein
MNRGRLEQAWDQLREQKLAALDAALASDIETFRIHAPDRIEGLKRFNADQRRQWEDPEPPEHFQPPRQSYIERPLDIGPASRETIVRRSETAWETVIEVDDNGDYSELPNDGR